MSMGARLRKLRGKLSQSEFAALIGSSQSGISAYEKDQRKPNYETLMRVSKAFFVNLEWLLTGEGAMRQIPAAQGETTDVSDALEDKKTQQADFIDGGKSKMTDVSAISCSAEQMFMVQRELLDVTRQNGDLRVEVERLRMDVERRDARIAELERQLVEALKPQNGQAVLDKRNAAAG